jgi:hypothetical protein
VNAPSPRVCHATMARRNMNLWKRKPLDQLLHAEPADEGHSLK